MLYRRGSGKRRRRGDGQAPTGMSVAAVAYGQEPPMGPVYNGELASMLVLAAASGASGRLADHPGARTSRRKWLREPQREAQAKGSDATRRDCHQQ